MFDISELFQVSASTVVWTIFIITVFAYGIWPYTYLKRYGIPGPIPLPFIGNLPLLASMGEAQSALYLSKRFGRIAGYYFGRYPAVIVNDLDMIQKILVTDNPSFCNRYQILPPKGVFVNSIFFAKNDHWKMMRYLLSPTFSNGQLKQVVPLIQKVIMNAKNNFGELADQEQEFDITTVVGRFTLDVISTTAFGVEIDSQKNPNCPLVKSCLKFVKFNIFSSLIPLSFICRPLWYLVDFLRFPGTLENKLDYLVSFCQDTIKFRKTDKTANRRDMMQLMLEARMNNNNTSIDEEESASLKDFVSKYQDTQSLTDKEITSNALTFLVGGYETTSSTFAFLIHSLAFNQDAQEKVYKEIMNVIGEELPNQDNVRELMYLDMCLSETLRKYPVVTRLNREADEDIKVGDWTIPSYTDVVIPVYSIHNSPEYYPDPEKFIPERFTPEAKGTRHPYTYMPFGKGPRSCLGMRLARLELKMLAASILREFKFTPCSKTEDPIQLTQLFFLRAKNGVWLNVTRRGKA